MNNKKIDRPQYLSQLIERQNNGMVKIITGIRRCGKSFLLFNIFKAYLLESGIPQENIIELSLEDIENDELRDPKACFHYIKSRITTQEKYYALIDEVQFLPRFEEVLNSLIKIQNLDIYITGSNSRFLSKDIVTEFRGRGDEIHIYPLSFAEYLSAVPLDFDDAWVDFMTYGGLPAITYLKTDKQKSDYLKNIFQNVYIKDVIERNHLKNKGNLDDLVRILASAIGSSTNPTKIANTFLSQKKITYTNKTVSAHIDFLEESFLISKANRYDIKGRKYIGTNLKYYFSDIGLRNACLNFRQQEETLILENVIYNELLIRGYNVDVGVVELSQKNAAGNYVKKQTEVDFVVNQGSRRYYIQVANDISSPEKQNQEFNSIRHIHDSFKKIVIINKNIKTWQNEEGFVIMGLKNFLLNPKCFEE